MIRVKITTSNIIIFQIYFNIILKFLTVDLRMPSAISYFSDMVTLLLMCCLLSKNRKINRIEQKVLLILFLFFIEGALSALFNGVSPVLFLWSVRNQMRFYIWIFIVIFLFDCSKIDKLFQGLNRLAIINLLIMIFQYLFFNLRGDYLNGVFGSYAGGNSALNTFCVILTIENVAALLIGKRKVKKVAIAILSMCIMCAMNELKFYYIELVIVIIFFIAFFMQRKIQKKTWKRLIFISVSGLLLAIIGYKALVYFYPGFYNFFEKEVFLDYVTRSYNSSTVLYINGIPVSNRFTAYNIVIKYFLNSTTKLLFGIGMGASEYSTYFSSAFHKKYGDIAISGYQLPQVLLENGIIGLCILVFFYLFIYKIMNMEYKRIITTKRYLFMISGITAVIGLFICVYNSALRIETSGYLYYTMIALGMCRKMGDKYDSNED